MKWLRWSAILSLVRTCGIVGLRAAQVQGLALSAEAAGLTGAASCSGSRSAWSCPCADQSWRQGFRASVTALQ